MENDPSSEYDNVKKHPKRKVKRWAWFLILGFIVGLCVCSWIYRHSIQAWMDFQQRFESLGTNDQGLTEYRHIESGIIMVFLPGGTFTIGSPSEETHSWDIERPQKEIYLSAFLISKYEISQAQWEELMGESPSSFGEGRVDLPVETISWHDCQSFCEKFNLKIPTEAQWEYACRGGSTQPFSFGKSIHSDQVNFNGEKPYLSSSESSFRGETLPVNSLKPNAFGLFHMHGNVREWCRDIYDEEFYKRFDTGKNDPFSNIGSGHRVIRGGGWFDQAKNCRSATRNWHEPSHRARNLGFRPVWEFKKFY